MKKLFETKPYYSNDEDGENTEVTYVFELEDEEIDDFTILNHVEQLTLLGFKEERTPKSGTVHRYTIYPTDYTVVVVENIMKW